MKRAFPIIIAVLATLGAAMPAIPFDKRAAVTDPVLLAELQAKHAESIRHQREGKVYSVVSEDEGGEYHLASPQTAKRQVPLVTVIAGIFAELLTSEEIDAIAFALKLGGDIDRAMGVEDAIWDSTDECRITFTTHSGGNEKLKSFNEGEDSADTDSTNDVGWVNPETSDPPVFYFTDESLGSWSAQFTATDGYAWDGINGTTKCDIEGLCNPQFVFYRDGYNIILNSWQSQGVTSDCYYHSDCHGLCNSGVKDQFSDNCVVWGGACAVPCVGDAVEGGTTTVPTGPSKSDTLKFMIVGDSISHGMERDYSWRWRLYAWLQDSGYNIEFVGPYSGTLGPTPQAAAEPAPPLLSGETATTYDISPGDYNPDVPDGFVHMGHGAYWGRQAMQVKETVGEWVATYQPDYMLVMLGFNDLGWFVSGPDGLIGSMGALVENARESKSDVQFLIGNVVDRTFIEGRDDLVSNTLTYNNQLANTIPNWFRWVSPIAYVDINSVYQCKPESCPDGYDGLHPNAMGEYHIAQAFAGTLKDSFNFQGDDFAVPDSAPGRDISTPGSVVAEGIREGTFTGWAIQEYARGYEIRMRIEGMSGWWSDNRVYPFTTASVDTWVENGQTWEFQVCTLGDGGATTDWSASVFATVDADTAPGPDDIVSNTDGDDGILITWSAVSGYDVNRYGVIVWDLDTEGAFINTQATTSTSYIFTGLISGHRYGTWVATYVSMTGTLNGVATAIGGLPAVGRAVLVGGGTPGAPTGLSVVNDDPTTITLSWSAVSGAAGYAIYYITTLDNWTPTTYTIAGETTDTSYTVGFLYPGTWNYQFCIAAFNGQKESAHTDCVIPDVYPGYDTKRALDLDLSNSTVANVTAYNRWEDKTFQKLHNLVRQNDTMYQNMIPLE